MSSELFFDFHGVRLSFACEEAELRERIADDFSFFSAPPTPLPAELAIRAIQCTPDYEALPALQARFYSPRKIGFTYRDCTYIDYLGRALSIYDPGRGTLEIHCEDLDLLHEISFLSTVGRVAERLEERKMHRLNALTIECEGEAAIFLVPPGGGKTTLALQFLRSGPPYRFLSEDYSLIDADGKVYPFPLRLGIEGERPEGFAEEHVVHFERMELEPKYLISLDAFEGAIATHFAQPRHLFIGERTLTADCTIRSVGFATGLRTLIREMVLDVELYEGIEFLLDASAMDIVRKSRLLLSRLRRALSLLRSCEIYVVSHGRDKKVNSMRLMAFLQSRGFGGRVSVLGVPEAPITPPHRAD